MTKWFQINKLSLSTKKPAFSLYYKPVALQILRINSAELKTKANIKLLEVLFFSIQY